MMEYNRKAPTNQVLPYEVWAIILDLVRDRDNLKRRTKMLVRTSRFSQHCDFLDLARIYEVTNELDYFFKYKI